MQSTKRKPKNNLEQRIQNMIKKVLTVKGYTVFRANAGTIVSQNGSYFKGLPAGFPDLFGFTKDGKIFFIEVKTPKANSRLRDSQKMFAKKYLEKSNCIYGVARSAAEALEIVEKELQGYGY